MSRYIDADALAYIVANNGDADFINKVTRLMIDAPSIDIVKCKECKFLARFVDDGHIECRLFSHPLRHEYHEMKPDDFCSYGERSDT